MAYTFGFLGTGHMGSALAEAACACAGASEVIVANRTPEKAQRLAERLGCTAADNEMVINSAAYLFLGAKPQDMFTLLDAIAPLLAARKTPFVLVSMAAGITLQELADHTSPAYPILRIMPNTPVAIGEGMTYYTPNANVTQAQLDAFLSGIAGCGPAFRAASRRGQRRFRLRRRVLQPVHRGAGRRRRRLRLIPRAGLPLCRADAHRHVEADARERQASRCSQG